MSDRTTGAFGSFDAQRPPAASELADCVHCGFCLPSCPTYGLWAEEMDSPRGRIDLVKGVLEGSLDMSTSFVAHMDACLGCMACVQACPSGVRYDHILQAARAQIERRVRRPLADRAFRAAVFMVFPHPHRMRAAAVGAWAYRRSGLAGALRRHGATERLPPRLAAIEALAPDVRITDLFRRLPVATRAQGRRRRRVGLLSGCVAQVYFSDVHAATIRALAAEGCEVLVPRGQGCCGALAVHAGREAQAMAAARATVDAWEGTGIDTLVTNAAGCGSSLKEHGALLADDPAYAARAAALSAKVMDVTELLASLPRQAPRHELALRVAYHDACHLGHAQGVTAQPRQVLRSIPGLELVELGDAGTCCGSAGIYNLVQPEAAADLGRAKAASVRAAAADVVVSANPGCLLQLRRHLGPQPPLAHPVELLDASIRGVNPWPAGDLGLSGSPGRDREPLAGSAPRSAPRPR